MPSSIEPDVATRQSKHRSTGTTDANIDLKTSVSHAVSDPSSEIETAEPLTFEQDAQMDRMVAEEVRDLTATVYRTMGEWA